MDNIISPEAANLIGQILIALFMIFCCYGAMLLVGDSNRRWKERYGDRWFLTRSEKIKLDKAYAERQTARKAARGVKRTDLHRFVDNRDE